MSHPLLIAIMGPTASGKSDLAEAMAEILDAEIINADAFQVYRGLDIGTAKPTDRSRYSLLDLVDPSQQFGLGQWIRLAVARLGELYETNKNAIVVGGTGLYIRALMEEYDEIFEEPDASLREFLSQRIREEGLDVMYAELVRLAPALASKVDRGNPRRVLRALEIAHSSGEPYRVRIPDFGKHKFAIIPNERKNDEIYVARIEKMVQNGWLGEVGALQAGGTQVDDPGMRAIGYREVWDHLRGMTDFATTVAKIATATRRYAKRQRTWLRSEPNLTVLDAETAEQALRQIRLLLNV